MRPLAAIAAALVLLLGACGLRSDEELAEALLGDVEIEVGTTSTTGSTTSTTAAPSTTGPSSTEAGEDDGGDDDGGDEGGDEGGDDDGGDDAGDDALPRAEEPGDLGDDAALDQFADRCFSGDLEACDDLYLESPLGSDYERYGSTCARRNGETYGGCVELYDSAPDAELPPGEDPGDLGDDPALDDLTQRCFEGEMQACDQLYFQSPLGSDYETYGATCGGRTEADGGACVATYGSGD